MTPLPEPGPQPEPLHPWLVRIPEVFAAEGEALARRWSPLGSTPLGTEYHLLKSTTTAAMSSPEAALYAVWRLPVEHSWPCRPRTMEGFVEKAAQALAQKFSSRSPQTILVGLLQTGTPNVYYKKLASNLRGRALQVFPALPAAAAGEVRPDQPVLFCLLGPEGLYAGLATPKQANGFLPGGTRPLAHGGPEAISRAGAKIGEALDHLRLHRAPLPQGSHWLELGASPGGMTAELLARHFRVTAVDRAVLDQRLQRAPGLTFFRVDAPAFRAPPGVIYDALLSDLNGEVRAAMQAVLVHRRSLRPGALVVFTLKLTGVEAVAGTLALRDGAVAMARSAGLVFVAQTHLPSNRREFTLFFEIGASLPDDTSHGRPDRRGHHGRGAAPARSDARFRRGPHGPGSGRGAGGPRGR